MWIWYQLNFIEWAWSKIRRSAFIYCDWLGLFISCAGVSHIMSSGKSFGSKYCAECIKELQVLDIFLAHWTLQVTDYKVLKEKLIFFVQMVQLSVPLLDIVFSVSIGFGSYSRFSRGKFGEPLHMWHEPCRCSTVPKRIFCNYTWDAIYKCF